MGTKLKGQVTGTAAERYEKAFVPAIFQPWASTLTGVVGVRPGDQVLDVACGTGAFARTVAHRVTPGGAVHGIDLNEGMLEVARQKAPGIDWRQGNAEALPYEDETFDVVVSQFGLMFFDDPAKGLAEMWRVLKPEGRLAVSVWDRIENSPGYAALAAHIEEQVDAAAAEEIRSPFRLGQPAELRRLLKEAGIPNADIEAMSGNVRFDSLEAWMTTEIKAWTLAERIDDAKLAALIEEVPKNLRGLTARDGVVRFAMPAQVISAKKP